MIWRLVTLFLTVVIVIAGINAYLSPDDLAKCQSVEKSGKCRRADAIVVISGGDTIARTDEAIDLFKKDWAGHIVFSGAAADKEGPSNALAMQQHALDRGVPESLTVIEDQSETTKQNAAKVRQLLEEKNLRDIILVTSGYHMRRASLEFSRELGDGFSIRSHPVGRDNQWSSVWWLTPWGWWIAIGELVRIGVFTIGASR